jgi:hypothetical protein
MLRLLSWSIVWGEEFPFPFGENLIRFQFGILWDAHSFNHLPAIAFRRSITLNSCRAYPAQLLDNLTLRFRFPQRVVTSLRKFANSIELNGYTQYYVALINEH